MTEETVEQLADALREGIATLQNEPEIKPVDLTDEYMAELFSRIAQNKHYRPYKGEVEQFFQSRIWRIVEEEAANNMAMMFKALAVVPMTTEKHAYLSAMIKMMSWWLNLEDNLFAARTRALTLEAQDVGGEPWQENR